MSRSFFSRRAAVQPLLEIPRARRAIRGEGSSIHARSLWLYICIATLLAGSAHAACGGFLPDLTCDEKREARPEGHVSPMSMPYLFEDPYITTGLNLVGIYHNFPSDSVFSGGEAGVIALQARLAITDRLAFIATKDGFTFIENEQAVLDDARGFMDVTIGFKYALIDDREKGLIVSPSLRYEIPIGQQDLLQGQGDGVLIPAVSVGWGPDNIHIVSGLGAQIAMDSRYNSSSIFWNLHLDQAFEVDFIPGADFIVPFIELNTMFWVNGGDGDLKLDTSLGTVSLSAAQDLLHGLGQLENRRFEGADVANLGSKGMAGEEIVTMAWGVRVPFQNGVSTGLSYERILSQRQDIFEQRFTAMVEYTF
jgi:hypothetical protein